ncbi:MAG: hypothetical protein ABIS34_12385 [Opitutus sp.]
MTRMSFTFLAAILLIATAHAAEWLPPPYADEIGYQQRIRGMVSRIAATDYLSRVMARSTCPDTGRPVFTWALAGEEISSPFTGRRYVQGDTGYFGPKKRDAEGRIVAFGGDPLKQSLPPATAALVLDPNDAAARGYLSIPGNLRQQYHFACVNWVRFLGLVGSAMPPQWHRDFLNFVGSYEEAPRSVEGAVSEYQPLEHTETLVGLVGEHLGGGGTENHKTMWRSSGLLYAQTFPAGSMISGFSLAQAEADTNHVLTTYVHQLFTIGNGEYDSSTYYPYSFRAFSNVYDFSPKPETRAMARAALDGLLATYGLKLFNGVHTGPQRRGWVEGDSFAEMERHLWVWAGGAVNYTTVPVDATKVITTLHQATSKYRPNQLIVDLMAKQVALPFEAYLNHPDYGMTTAGRQPEYFYCSRHFAMGSVQMDTVNNSAQQTTWTLNVRGTNGSLIFGGGQPRWLNPEGHSPYDQWVQKRGALLFMTSGTQPKTGQPVPETLARIDQLSGPRSYSRQAAYSGPLNAAAPPVASDATTLDSYVRGARTQAATWLFVPKAAAVRKEGARFIVTAPDVAVVITPFNKEAFWLPAFEQGAFEPSSPAKILERYRVLVVPEKTTGFAIEAVEGSARDHLDAGSLTVEGRIARYRSIAGDTLELEYQPAELRPKARISGELIDWDKWAGGAVCESPYLRIKDGEMWVSNGRQAYRMDYTGNIPTWAEARP